jgi:hypothetical protein
LKAKRAKEANLNLPYRWRNSYWFYHSCFFVKHSISSRTSIKLFLTLIENDIKTKLSIRKINQDFSH